MPAPTEQYSPERRRGDGVIEIQVSEDNMSVIADIFPPLGSGDPVSPDYASLLLSRLNINYGVDWALLNEAILEVNTDRKKKTGLVIARGSKPTAERGELTTFSSRLSGGFKPVDEEKHSVDWREISAFLLVKKGEILASIAPPLVGILGNDVYGNPIPYPKETTESYSLGKNVERVDDKIIATMDGRLIRDGKKILVEETLVIPGNVDYRVGHIMFPGDVMIQGGVSDGFKVYSGGSVTIQQTMDAFDVSVKKDLICMMGLIGKDQGLVRVGGELKAKFVENAKVAVRGNAEISGSVVGSKLYILGALNMSDKSRIVGGETWATHGIKSGWLGGSTRPLTIVNAGIDFTMQQKLNKANASLRELAVKVARLDQILKQRPEPKIQAQRDQLAEKAAALSASIQEIARLVDINEDAAIELKFGVYPGVMITICHASLKIEKPLKKTRFSLDKIANKIIVES